MVRGRGSHLLASADAVGSDVLKLVLTVVWTAAVGRIQWMACAAPGIPTNCCSPDLLCIRWLRKYRWYYFYMQILQKVTGVLRALSIAELMDFFLLFCFVFSVF